MKHKKKSIISFLALVLLMLRIQLNNLAGPWSEILFAKSEGQRWNPSPSPFYVSLCMCWAGVGRGRGRGAPTPMT